MATKSKESSEKPEQNTNILNKLFGEASEEQSDSAPFTSLFSSENPFRRKPENNPQIPTNPNPKKRNIEESPNLSAQDTPEKGKKLKEKELEKTPNLGNVNGVELAEKKEKNKKKKRKRDELEREYEAKKYGVVVGDEEERESVKVKVGKKRKAVDNPLEAVAVSKEEEGDEGYDDESKLLRTVFVGNLPLKVKKKVLLKEFSQFGEVASVRIRSVPTLDSKKPKKVMIYNGKLNEAADSVHAYIVFKTEEAAEASLAHNMSVVAGNHIRVDRACPPRKKLKGESVSTPLYSSKRTVFVGNLPFDVKDEELYQLFCGIKELGSSVEAVRVIRDRLTSLGKGIAYVLFKTRDAANLVCKKRKLKLRDRELRISHAKSESESTPSKRKDALPVESESSPPPKKLASGSKTPQSRGRFGRYKLSTHGDTSYQGFRASKSGDRKTTPSRSIKPTGFQAGPKKGETVKQRSEKRPSVAARKGKALAPPGMGGGVSKHAGNKRKMDARTPQSSHQNKKFRK